MGQDGCFGFKPNAHLTILLNLLGTPSSTIQSPRSLSISKSYPKYLPTYVLIISNESALIYLVVGQGWMGMPILSVWGSFPTGVGFVGS